MRIKFNLFISIIFIFLTFQNAEAQTAQCSTAPGGLCYGYNSADCSTSLITDCSSYPRCAYSGIVGGFVCKRNCYDTGSEGSCGSGRRCLCTNSNPCTFCTTTGKDLSACNDNGCGVSETQPPVIEINSPTADSMYASSISPITISGTASDNSVLTKITWSNNRNAGFVGGSGDASGTENWNIDFINLEEGQNIITVTAIDGAGNTSTDSITITYNPPYDQGYPKISVLEDASEYSVTISDTDYLSNVSYAWGEKPYVYFLLPFANDDEAVLSAAENERYEYLKNNFARDWDVLTKNLHPMKFVFLQPFKLESYSKNDNDFLSYIRNARDQFESSNEGNIKYPAIYVFMFPEPYFDRTYIQMTGSEEKKILAEVYFSMFNDTKMNEYSSYNEIISGVLQHEIIHNFAMLPNNSNFPPGDDKYFWLSHPAGFSGVQEECDESTIFVDCDPYGAADSPTGTDGYYEAYSIISMARLYITKANFGNRDPEMSPLVEMAMGVRSKYEDAPFMYYEGTVTGIGDNRRFYLVGSHNYGISSRWLYDYTANPNIKNSLYWNIANDNAKFSFEDNTKNFSVPKSNQNGRSLFVYASDGLNPGYYKVFGNNAFSDSVFDLVGPSSPTGLRAR